MVKDHEENEPAFKVFDRRRFSETGEERSVADSSDYGKEKNAVKTEPKPSEQASSTEKATKVRPKMTFSLFIQSLAHQAMMGLGIAPWPDSGLVRIDLDLAKESIDILKILKEKSVNNLNKEEQSLMETIIYQLQVAFVDVAKKPLENNESPIIK